MSNEKWKVGEKIVAFSEYLNFTDAKYCCVKATGDGSGVISADEGIVGTPDEYDY